MKRDEDTFDSVAWTWIYIGIALSVVSAFCSHLAPVAFAGAFVAWFVPVAIWLVLRALRAVWRWSRNGERP